MVASAQYAEAIDYLNQLDRSFPARSNRHSLDRERERVLHALGQAFEATDRKNLALETYRRAVAFDPRNVANHYALAAAALRFDEPEEAHLHLDRALEVHPSHLPSLRQLVEMEFESGDFQEVVSAYERYLDAFLIHWLTVGWSESRISTFVRVPVDGRRHTVEGAFPDPVDGGDALELRPGPFGLEVAEVRLRGPVSAGLPTPADSNIRAAVGPWTSAARPEWTATEFEDVAGDSSLLPHVVRVAVPDAPDPVTAAELHVRLLKPVDEATWARVETSYRNLIDYEGLEQARLRSFVAGLE
jgi:tetratricopeptide (TPR) repeat protein